MGRQLMRLTCLAAASVVVVTGAPDAAHAQSERTQLTLSQAVALARERHPSLGAARAGEEAAASAVGQATSARWPQLAGLASITTFEEPMLVAPLHRFEISAVPEFEETLLRGDLRLAWTLFDGGARGARVNGARASAAGALAGRLGTDMALTARVTRTYLEVLTARGVLEAQDRRIAALSAEGARVDQLLAVGRAARVERLRVGAALAEAEAGRVATSARLAVAERELARLIGVAAEETRADRLRGVRLVEAGLPEDRAALIADGRAGSPEVERARRELEAALADRRLARAAWFPKFDLVGGLLGFSSTEGGGTAEWQAGVSLSYPLFTGGGRAGAVASASARARAAGEELRSAELRLADQVDRALTAALEARARVEAVARAVELQGEVVRIEQLALEAGAGTQTDYLRAEADLLRAQSGLVEARHAEVAARVELARVLGELTPEWLERSLENEG